MKRRITVSALAALLLCALLASAVAESQGCWAGFFDYYYHASPDCAYAVGVALTDQKEAEAQGKYPCPVCVQDGKKYKGLECATRGGTVLLRMPDAWMASRKQIKENETFPWGWSSTGDAARGELANRLHGDAYARFLADYAESGYAEAKACAPGLAGGEDLQIMCQRHLGGAWYLVLRPGESARQTLKKKRRLQVDLRFVRSLVQMENGEITVTDDATWTDEHYTLKPKKSSNKTAFQQSYQGLALTVYRDMDANVCVVREDAPGFALPQGARLLIDGVDAGIAMDGYEEDGGYVYCCLLTDGEVDALKTGAEPIVAH